MGIMRMRAKTFFRIIKETFTEWMNDNTFTLGASLAYYTVFSMAPLLIIAVAIASFVFGEEAAQRQMSAELHRTLGPRVADAVNEIMKNVHKEDGGTFATIVSVIVLFVGATSVFGQLQSSLNNVWKVQQKKDVGIWGLIKARFWSLTVVLGIGFLLLVSLVASAVLSAIDEYTTSLPGGTYLWQIINFIISFGLVTILFAMIYKLLPDVNIEWKDVWVGAAVTSLLFGLGKYLIGLYLAQGSVTNAYGAAGSMVVILLWVYYSSQILLFGAEFTQVWARVFGRRFDPTETAEPKAVEPGTPSPLKHPGKEKVAPTQGT